MKAKVWIGTSIGVLVTIGMQGCGFSGEETISMTGVCDKYPDWKGSNYVLPYEEGISKKVSQGNCGAASHFGTQKFAYDINMDINTNIIAARAGTVISIKEDLGDGEGCPDANNVQIQHSDGSVAYYVHLTRGGALVDVGESVAQGDVIALSGNSGCSSGPHLHFVVLESDSSGAESVPVTFRNAGPNSFGLQNNSEYTAQSFSPDGS